MQTHVDSKIGRDIQFTFALLTTKVFLYASPLLLLRYLDGRAQCGIFAPTMAANPRRLRSTNLT